MKANRLSSIFYIISAIILFLGSIVVNLLSNELEQVLRTQFGNNYRLILTTSLLALALLTGIVAWRQINSPITNLPDQMQNVQAAELTVTFLDQSKNVEKKMDYRQKPTPDEIFRELSEAAPFQRDVLAKSYLGVKVSWKLEFFNIRDFGESYEISFSPSLTSTKLISAAIDIEKYPEVKSIKSGHSVRVNGRISKINTTLKIIDLSEASFMFE